jgi:hypothetical protein
MALERPDIFGLHYFAQGAVDFLVGAAALSVVIGLIASALEDVARPHIQGRIFYRWLFNGFYQGGKYYPPGEDSTKSRGEVSPFSDFLFSRLERLPPAFFALEPNQLCAQIIRRLQTVDADPEFRPERPGPPPLLKDDDGWSRWGERSENAVDELQVKLARNAAVRSYGFAACIAAGFGGLMYTLEPPSLGTPAAGLVPMFTLTAVFGGVAVLLSPIVQSLISRFLRPR